MDFSGGSVLPYPETNQSFLIPRLIIGSGRASMTSKILAQLRTVPRCWVEPFLLRVPMQIAFGSFYLGMPKLLFHRGARRPPVTAAAADTAAANVAAVAASFMSALTTTATGSLPAATAVANSSTATPSTPASSSIHKYQDVQADATFGSVPTSSCSGYEHSTTVDEIQENLLPWASRYIGCGYKSLCCDHVCY
jgi:hypothetical protein